MQSLEAACEEGERSYKKLKTSRSSLPLLRPQETEQPEIHTSKPPFCIFTKLRELYEEESAKDLGQLKTVLKSNSHLLEKLVAKERLNTLILNLYAGNKGYSLTFRTSSRTELNTDDTANMIETKQWPYEEDNLLRYIDNEELPSFIVDLLEPQFNFLFYNGCVITEVRNYRQAYPHFKCDIHHVLLRPTLQSILSDVNVIMEEKVDWGTEEKFQLESQLLVARTPNLCLEPNKSVCDAVTRISHNRQMWNTHRLRRMARKFSQDAVNKKRKLDHYTYRHGLELYETKLRSKPKTGGHALTNLNAKIPKKLHDEIKPIPVPNLDVPILNAPTQGVNITEFKAYQRPKESSDFLPQRIEEYILETDMPSKEKGKPRIYHIKLSILQRPSNSEYLGELYLDRDHKKNEHNGVACRFSLGTRAHVDRYIQQFTEIFTESGRKSVRIKYGLSPGYKERVALAQAQAAQIQAQHAAQTSLTQQHIMQIGQNLSSESCITPLVNGAVASSISLVQNQNTQNASSVPILQAQLQGSAQVKSSQITNEQIEINALATGLMNSSQQFLAAANAKQQQQKLASGNDTAIINLLNRSPVSNINSDASAAVVNAINNSTLLPQQVQTINHKLLGRKMTLSSVTNARVLNHSNLTSVNNNSNNSRMSIADLSSHIGQLSQSSQQGQTITLTSVNSGNFGHANYTTIKQPVVNQRVLASNSSESNKSALSALLVGTPAADRPDIIGPNTNSLLLEKLASTSGTSPNSSQNTTHFIQSPKSSQQFAVHSPKNNPVMSPLSSPPPQNTINVQSLNFTQLQGLSGVQNVQVQLPGFSQPISLALNVSSTGTIQGHPASLIVSLPVTTATATCTTITHQTASCSVTAGNTLGVGAPTVVLANTGSSSLAQLVTSGVKGLSQQGLRAAGPAGVTLSQGGQPFQLITPLQRPRIQQAGIQHNITARGIQRTPITIKMAAPNATAAQVTLPTNASMSTLASQLQKQAQLQPYQQLCLNQQQKNIPPSVAGKIRRRSNAEPQ